MRKEHNLTIGFTAIKIGIYARFFFAKIHGNNADYGIVVDDCAIGRNHMVIVKITRTKAVNVAHEYIIGRTVGYLSLNTLAHTACSPIGKRQTEHVFSLTPLFQSQTNAFS